MLKIISILILMLLIFISKLYSQTSFHNHYGSADSSEWGVKVHEMKNGNFLVMIRNSEYANNQHIRTNPEIMIVNPQGQRLFLKTFEEIEGHIVYDGIINNRGNDYLCMGTNNLTFQSDSIFFTEIDSNLLFNKHYSIHLFDSAQLLGLNYPNLNDEYIFVNGYMINHKNESWNFILKIDSNFQLVDSIMFSLGSYYFIKDIYFEPTLNKFFSLASNSQKSTVVIIDTNLNSYFKKPFLFSTNFPTSLTKKQNCYWSVGRHYNRPIFYKISNTGIKIDSVYIDTGQLPFYPAAGRAVHSSIASIYGAYTKNIEITSPIWGSHDSWFYIYKLDTSGNVIWEKEVGKQGFYYVLYDMTATSDGGCLLTGSSYEYGVTVGYLSDNNTVLIKLDSMGAISWLQYLPKNHNALFLFPNPSSDQFYLKNLPQGERVEQLQLFDMNGKLVLSMGAVEAQEAIGIRQLPQGLYLVEVRLTHGQRLTTKLVKTSGER